MKGWQKIMGVVMGLVLCGGAWWFYHLQPIEQERFNPVILSSSTQEKEETSATKKGEEKGALPNTTEGSQTQKSEKKQAIGRHENKPVEEAIVEAVTQLFETVYNYHSDQEAGSVAARKEAARQWATANALNQLFPKDADQLKPSVTTISQLEKAPEIYTMMTSIEHNPAPTQKALVLVHYAVTIAGSSQQTSAFLYQVTFDTKSQQVTNIRQLGEVSGF